MCKVARFFSVLSLGSSVGVGALAQPAGTEDADMTKEKLFPVGGGVGTHALPSCHARNPLSRWHGRPARGRRWTNGVSATDVAAAQAASELLEELHSCRWSRQSSDLTSQSHVFQFMALMLLARCSSAAS